MGTDEDFQMIDSRGTCKGLVYVQPVSGTFWVRRPLGKHGARERNMTKPELDRYLAQRRWTLKHVREGWFG